MLDDRRIGLEARVAADDHLSLKLWLRLLACSTQIEIEIRQRLRERFGVSLPRFDYLAQLHRHPGGLRMSALSRYLMVSGGNVTGLTDELEKEGLVERAEDPDDRRSWRVRLTDAGRSAFEAMAHEHEGWVVELFDGVDAPHKQALYEALGGLRVALVAVQGRARDPAGAQGSAA
ncbi:MAG: MarR family transcriptional regulator [Rubrivivax sp.]